MIQINITDKAKASLAPYLELHPDHQLKLVYDTAGCGCVNDGVIYLALEKDILASDKEIKSEAYPVYIEKQYEVYFEENLILDYSEGFQCFQLKSPNMIMNPRMTFQIA